MVLLYGVWLSMSGVLWWESLLHGSQVSVLLLRACWIPWSVSFLPWLLLVYFWVTWALLFLMLLGLVLLWIVLVLLSVLSGSSCLKVSSSLVLSGASVLWLIFRDMLLVFGVRMVLLLTLGLVLVLLVLLVFLVVPAWICLSLCSPLESLHLLTSLLFGLLVFLSFL
jgi:hypothetical protein